MRCCKRSLLCILFLSGASLWCQRPSDWADRFGDESVVRLKEETVVRMAVKKGQLQMEEENYLLTYFQSPRLNGPMDVRLEYEPPFSEITDIEAYAFLPDWEKDKYRKQRVRDFTDEKMLDDQVFHDGTWAKRFSFDELRKGAMTEMTYRETISEPRLYGRAIFQGRLYTEEQVFTLELEKGIRVDVDYFHCDSTWFERETEIKGSTRILRWRKRQIPSLKEEDQAPPFLHLSPHLVYRVHSFEDEEGQQPVLRNLDDLHRWYRTFLANLDLDDPGNQARQAADSVIKDLNTPREKAAALYEWVNQSIRYIAIEEGLGGFHPRPPNTVCDRRYGDCKDMSILLVAMMRYAGLEAYPVWVGTRRIPYRYERVPSALADNHMIAGLRLQGKWHFLDPTNKGLPFPYPSSFTQGKEALISLNADAYRVEVIPILPASLNLDRDTIALQLEGEDLVGKGQNDLFGYYAHQMNRNLEQKDGDKLNQRLENTFQKGNNRCKTDIEHYAREDSATVVRYSFRVPGYAQRLNDKLYLNLNLEKPLADLYQEGRSHPLDLEKTFHLQRVNRLNLPPGHQVLALPAKAENDFGPFRYRFSYHQEDPESVTYRLEIWVDTLRVEKEQMANWNLFIRELRENYRKSLTLQRNA